MINGFINLTRKYSSVIPLIFGLVFGFLIVPAGANKAQAYGECSEYGFMAIYDIFTGKCKCMSGYVFDDNIFGKPQCVLGNYVCQNKYGYGSIFDALSGSCECSYGYVWGKDILGRTQCVLPPSPDSVCKDQLGYNARYNILYDRCECSYGYVIDGGQCRNGDSVCSAKHGLYSDYNDSNKSCECDSGYTFDNLNQCVKKQNNVYFTLKELDTDTKRAIIRSDYDYRYYLVTYNTGCYSFSFRRYLNNRIVVNLGTDFNLDTWDKIVLQDDDEVCDITRIERADSSTTLEPEEDETIYSIPPRIVSPPVPTGPFKYLWKSQNGTISSDGKAHEVYASPGDTLAMSVTLVNRSGRTIQGLSKLPAVPGKINYGGWGLGTSKPIDNKPTWLDSSSFVINGNRFAYYNGSDVPDGGEFTIAWNVKISPSAKKGPYSLYLNCVKEWENWTQQVAANGVLLKSPDIFWRFIIS